MACGVSKASANPALRSTPRAASSTSPQRSPAATAATPAPGLRALPDMHSAPWLGPSQVHGACHIGAVTLENNTEVEGQESPPGQARGGRSSCGRAERAPEATMVSNDMPSAPAAAPGAPTPQPLQTPQGRPYEVKNMLEELAPHQRRLSHQRQLVFVFYPAQGLNQRGRQSGKKVAPKPRRQSRPISSQIGNGSFARIKSGALHSRLRCQPLHGGHSRRAGHNLYLRCFDLFSSLRHIASIGKQAGRTACDGQRGARPCESREIAKIRQVVTSSRKAGFVKRRRNSPMRRSGPLR